VTTNIAKERAHIRELINAVETDNLPPAEMDQVSNRAIDYIFSEAVKEPENREILGVDIAPIKSKQSMLTEIENDAEP
jgi:hypothetical protein